MNYEALRLAKLHREVVGMYYTPCAYESKEHTNYHGETELFTPCYFCPAKAEHNHFTPNLMIFNEWIEKKEFRLLEGMRLTVCPICTVCLEKLNNSTSVNLDDQAAFINAIRNGTFNPIFHAGNS